MTARVYDTKVSDTAPLSSEQLQKVVNDACGNTLTQEYSHELSAQWNDAIVGKIIEALKTQVKGYKFIVYSTLVDKSTNGPNGIRTTNGMLINPDKDGVWNYKFEGQYTDAIVSIAWLAAA